MVQEAQPRLMKRVTSFLLASRPTWRSPPSMEPRLPHSHLYPSPRRFLVESHLLLGCSHKIPNGTSSAFGLSRRSTVASNTILGLCSQGSSRHVLLHAAPGFLAGCGYGGWWSSPNFASILLASRDDILALCSGGRTQDHGMTILSSGVAMVFSLGLAGQGPGHLLLAVELRVSHRSPSQTAWHPYQDTVCTWSTRSLSAIGSTDMSAAGLMTSFQSLSFSGGSGISTRGHVLRRHSAPVGRYTTTSLITRCLYVKILVALSHSMG
jgi:hypothetical protein